MVPIYFFSTLLKIVKFQRSGNNQNVRSSAPVVSRRFPGGYNVKLYISRGRLAWWLLAFLCCDTSSGECSVALYSGVG